jgi:hypothetical protein
MDKKPKKKRSEKYDTKLKVDGTFDQLVKIGLSYDKKSKDKEPKK